MATSNNSSRRGYHRAVVEVADLTDPLVVAVSRRIAAPARDLFDVLCDPKRHHEFDGSNMVRDTDASRIEAVGDIFVMRMHNDEFGDYEMRNTVVEYIQDRAIAWAPKRQDVEGAGWNQRWGWRLSSDGDATEVTAFFDCSRVPEDGRRILRGGERWRTDLERSLEKLEALVVR